MKTRLYRNNRIYSHRHRLPNCQDSLVLATDTEFLTKEEISLK